ncbi:DUF2889 domain-containing protein [Syntrophomonas palmitatica]|uniref:DUF2889 domain-containing protein n=1 Tax=Syntrophomonas palmitatica TaxID=402877 RepID=UPI0012EE3532|nr:DUF2889 domain-containing protein [Syntrophomonas palmitatica]
MQRIWHSSVVREDEHYLIAKTSYLDSLMERMAAMRVNSADLVIERAWLERLGRPGDMAESREYVEELKGVEAYLGSSSGLRTGLQGINNEAERSLFNDTVIAIVQAETFLFRERGYSDAAAYSRAWEEFYAGSCRYYSNLDRVKTTWGAYIGNSGREINLFDRGKSQQLYRDDDDNYIINGSLIDSFHQVNTRLELNKDMVVIAAHGHLLRVPDAVCRESALQMQNLKGRFIKGIAKKELAGLLGAGQGCVHLIDLVYDSVKTLELYLHQEKILD